MVITCSVNGQRLLPAVSLIAGSDFTAALTQTGLEIGVYTADYHHSLSATIEADGITNADLITYGRQALVHQETSLGKYSHSIGVKYVGQLLQLRQIRLAGVVHPWYSVNLSIKSAWFGARIYTIFCREAISAEVVYDPFGGRYALRLGFSSFAKRSKNN